MVSFLYHSYRTITAYYRSFIQQPKCLIVHYAQDYFAWYQIYSSCLFYTTTTSSHRPTLFNRLAKLVVWRFCRSVVTVLPTALCFFHSFLHLFCFSNSPNFPVVFRILWRTSYRLHFFENLLRVKSVSFL